MRALSRGVTQVYGDRFVAAREYISPEIERSVVLATDAGGNQRSAFLLTENVYVKGKLFPSNMAVTIYLIPVGANDITANAVANTTAIADSNGNLSTTLVWSSPLMQGSYDIWVDVNQHSAFDASDVWKRME